MGMIQFDSGKKHESGAPIYANIDENIARTLRAAIKRNQRSFDYKSCCTGFSGNGKSTAVRQFGNYIKYCMKKYHKKDVGIYICFTADEMEAASKVCPKYSVIILDEAFADLNSGVSRSKDFQKVINLLQIIRQKSTFVFICLPNYFDLSKSVALFQTNHLFHIDTDKNDRRGTIRCYDRDRKQALYLRGKKELNYHACKPNYLARFYKDEKAMDNEAYEKKKTEHFLRKNAKLEKVTTKSERDDILVNLKNDFGFSVADLVKVSGLKERNIYKILKKRGDVCE